MSNQKNLEFGVAGIGIYGPGIENWESLKKCLMSNDLETDQFKAPKPEIIPANERRRAPLAVKLAVESSLQAMKMANLDLDKTACVFGSGLGDTEITDYMCKALNTETKQLSPTKFHNSVHNAAAGYWTISSHCTQPANSIAGYKETFSLTLLEAVTQCIYEDTPVLLTLFDTPVADVMTPTLTNNYPFAASLVLLPPGAQAMYHSKLFTKSSKAAWPELQNTALNPLYQENPSAKILCLLQNFAGDSNKVIDIPLSSVTALEIETY